VLSRFVVRFWCAFHNLFTADPSEDFLQAGRLFALFVHGGEQAPKRFNLAILLIWHEIMMSEVVKRFTVCFVPKSQQLGLSPSPSALLAPSQWVNLADQPVRKFRINGIIHLRCCGTTLLGQGAKRRFFRREFA
jgi:hypothetical protein